MLKRIASFTITILCISACAVIDTQATAQFTFNVAEPNRIRFSGKGAGAGMMLSSSMGAMGVAIGIAIDAGIAKDIQETASKNGIIPSEIVKAKLQQAFGKSNRRHILWCRNYA